MPPVVTVSRDEIVAHLERAARRRLGISAKELLRRYREGRLEDASEVADLVVLADTLRKDDPLFEAP